MSQFSLFGAAAAEPGIDDLEGVLLAGGHWVRTDGRARLSIVVGDRWRAEALAEEFEVRGLADAGGPETVVPAPSGWSVRTAFGERLAPLAARWSRGASEGPPPGFALTPGGLRLWALAAGRQDEAGYVFATERADGVHQLAVGALHLAAGSQLSRLGLAAVSLGARGGPGWRVTSARRLRRLAELLGPAPRGGERHWPPG